MANTQHVTSKNKLANKNRIIIFDELTIV